MSYIVVLDIIEAVVVFICDQVYSGYVDDPRNTDNCWMETVAVNFHDEDGTSVSKISLKAGKIVQKVLHPI